MSNILGRVAVTGIGVGVISLTIAGVIGGSELSSFWQNRRMAWHGHGCDGSAKSEGSSERHLAWTGGDAIDISLPATVHFRAGEGSDIVVRGAPGTIANIEVRGRQIVLDCRSSGMVDVTLPGNTFRRIGVAGWADVRLENLNQPELVFTLSGSGNLAAQGKIDRLTATISGSGNAHLRDLALKELTVKVTGSGNVEAAPTDVADINLTGSGNVRLLSRPARLNTHVAGSGRISQVAETEGKK